MSNFNVQIAEGWVIYKSRGLRPRRETMQVAQGGVEEKNLERRGERCRFAKKGGVSGLRLFLLPLLFPPMAEGGLGVGGPGALVCRFD